MSDRAEDERPGKKREERREGRAMGRPEAAKKIVTSVSRFMAHSTSAKAGFILRKGELTIF